MSSRTRINTFKRENCLVDIIFQHKGKGNAIGTKELALALSERGYKVPPDQVHGIVKKVMLERRLPICSNVTYGYYWATSKQDLQSAINELQDKIQGLQERIDLLKSFMFE